MLRTLWHKKPGSTLAESFRAVRTSLAFYTGQTKCPVVLVSSPVSGEGKTFVSVNLATIISMMNKKVLIVDSTCANRGFMQFLRQATDTV